MAANGFEVGSYKPGKSEPGPPMDLANMRKNGVRSLLVGCLDCHRDAIVNMDDYPVARAEAGPVGQNQDQNRE